MIGPRDKVPTRSMIKGRMGVDHDWTLIMPSVADEDVAFIMKRLELSWRYVTAERIRQK